MTNPQTNTNCKHAIPDNLGYINCTRSDSTIALCSFPCPYGQHKDRWEWDKQAIQHYRKVHEPHNDFERLMLEKAQSNPYWIKMWASQGNVEKRVLPSGLTILIKRDKNKFEEFILTDAGKVLDFSHEPKDNQTKLNKPLIDLKATSSASRRGCVTSPDKPVSNFFQRKRRVKSSANHFKNVTHFAIEADGVECYA